MEILIPSRLHHTAADTQRAALSLLHHRTQFIWAPHYRRRRLIEPCSMLPQPRSQIPQQPDAPFRQQPSLLPLSLKSCTISAVLSEPRHLHPSSATVDFRRTSSLQAVAG
ncbi:hypothetical protein M0R45_001234 [Rubus argutus]|uniref:Uncharacterized protein n=1 Tax=Rubus argutus TaxID=59490 RepID=A0AAW1VLW5_RUBAR